VVTIDSVDQRPVVGRRQGELAGASVAVADVTEKTRDRLLFEPLACVAFVDARLGGELGRGEGAVPVERLVQTEGCSDVDGEELEGAGGGVGEPLGDVCCGHAQ
jgi:hypothetical protein